MPLINDQFYAHAVLKLPIRSIMPLINDQFYAHAVLKLLIRSIKPLINDQFYAHTVFRNKSILAYMNVYIGIQ